LVDVTVNYITEKNERRQMLKQNVNNSNLKSAPCKACGKTVEVSQQIKIDNHTFHRAVL
jgi:hypothetical protein